MQAARGRWARRRDGETCATREQDMRAGRGQPQLNLSDVGAPALMRAVS